MGNVVYLGYSNTAVGEHLQYLSVRLRSLFSSEQCNAIQTCAHTCITCMYSRSVTNITDWLYFFSLWYIRITIHCTLCRLNGWMDVVTPAWGLFERWKMGSFLFYFNIKSSTNHKFEYASLKLENWRVHFQNSIYCCWHDPKWDFRIMVRYKEPKFNQSSCNPIKNFPKLHKTKTIQWTEYI